MRTVFVSGSFDIINAGHCRMFRLAREQGDELVVGLNTDDIISRDKGHNPIIPYEQRKEIIEAVRWIDRVVKIDNIYHLEVVKELDADVYVTVEAWKDRQKETIEWVLAKGGSIYTPPYFPFDGVTLSSSDIRRRCADVIKAEGIA